MDIETKGRDETKVGNKVKHQESLLSELSATSEKIFATTAATVTATTTTTAAAAAVMKGNPFSSLALFNKTEARQRLSHYKRHGISKDDDDEQEKFRHEDNDDSLLFLSKRCNTEESLSQQRSVKESKRKKKHDKKESRIDSTIKESNTDNEVLVKRQMNERSGEEESKEINDMNENEKKISFISKRSNTEEGKKFLWGPKETRLSVPVKPQLSTLASFDLTEARQRRFHKVGIEIGGTEETKLEEAENNAEGKVLDNNDDKMCLKLVQVKIDDQPAQCMTDVSSPSFSSFSSSVSTLTLFDLTEARLRLHIAKGTEIKKTILQSQPDNDSLVTKEIPSSSASSSSLRLSSLALHDLTEARQRSIQGGGTQKEVGKIDTSSSSSASSSSSSASSASSLALYEITEAKHRISVNQRKHRFGQYPQAQWHDPSYRQRQVWQYRYAHLYHASKNLSEEIDKNNTHLEQELQ
eukprot:Awhi_evm1s3150